MSVRQNKAVDDLIAERLRAYRKQCGLTQGELAQQLGITFQQIQKYEKGTNGIGAGRLFEIARILRVPVSALFPESGDVETRERHPAGEAKAVADFIGTLEGWRLCKAFLRLKDLNTRRAIIALIEKLVQQ